MRAGLMVAALPSASADATSARGGSWDSIHVFEAAERTRTRSAHYKLTSTVMLHLTRRKDALGDMELGGSMTRQVRQETMLSARSFSSDADIVITPYRPTKTRRSIPRCPTRTSPTSAG